ncbi:MAG: hypothetical protein FWD57_16630, partial [Polyangiaceae bacterium]|nr:hypothetical protein [Polyangiaceae bacterium]
LRSDRCYMFIAVGGRGIEDLDTALLDPGANLVRQDTGDDVWPMFAYCPTQTGRHQYWISVERGAGRFHYQVWERRP